jgi:hypothetical protein
MSLTVGVFPNAAIEAAIAPKPIAPESCYYYKLLEDERLELPQARNPSRHVPSLAVTAPQDVILAPNRRSLSRQESRAQRDARL